MFNEAPNRKKSLLSWSSQTVIIGSALEINIARQGNREVGGAILSMARSILTPYRSHLSSTIK